MWAGGLQEGAWLFPATPARPSSCLNTNWTEPPGPWLGELQHPTRARKDEGLDHLYTLIRGKTPDWTHGSCLNLVEWKHPPPPSCPGSVSHSWKPGLFLWPGGGQASTLCANLPDQGLEKHHPNTSLSLSLWCSTLSQPPTPVPGLPGWVGISRLLNSAWFIYSMFIPRARMAWTLSSDNLGLKRWLCALGKPVTSWCLLFLPSSSRK